MLSMLRRHCAYMYFVSLCVMRLHRVFDLRSESWQMSKVHVHDNHDLYGIDHLLNDQARCVIYNSLRVESFGRWI
jgi:hypothetical protein